MRASMQGWREIRIRVGIEPRIGLLLEASKRCGVDVVRFLGTENGGTTEGAFGWVCGLVAGWSDGTRKISREKWGK